MTIYSINKAQQYKQLVKQAYKLDDYLSDELLEAAVHAVNAVAKYVNKGHMRKSVRVTGDIEVDIIEIVTAKEVVVLPSVELFLHLTHVDVAMNFLSSMTGIAVVMNQMSFD